MNSIAKFAEKKNKAEKISMITCYDYSFAKLVADSEIDCILVGDSLAMVMHGFDSTIHATPELMEIHTAAVRRGAKGKFIVGDMPFLSFRKGPNHALDVAARLMRAGANCVKVEGLTGHEDSIKQLVDSGIPVMGHLGLTPQMVHQLSGYKVQGRDVEAAHRITEEALKLEDLGCFSTVLECVPSLLAKQITENLKIPTIGIGAGSFTDGQVLVLQDMLGMNLDFSTKFVRKFSEVGKLTSQGLSDFHRSIGDLSFPSQDESFS